MPVRHERSDARGRPPLGRRGGIGKNGSTRSHNTSGSSVAAIHRSRYLADEYQVSAVLLHVIRLRSMLRSAIRVLCVLALAVRAAFGQAAGLPETLSADDRELVRPFLELSLKRVGWSADSAVLLDSMRQVCDGSARRDCLNPTLLDDLTLPSATVLMPECARVDYPALRKAFVDRNIRTWRIGAFQTPLTIASGS
jgi:hypothetical protein